MTPSSQAETGLDSFIFVAVKTLLWLCYGRTNVILIPSLLFTQSCCWWPRPKSTHHTRHVTRTRHVGPVSGVQWQDTCPVSSEQDTCPVSSVQDTFPGHVSMSTHFHWPGSGAGPAHYSFHHGGHLAGHPGIIITCCSSNTDKYTTYNIPTANFSSIQSLKPGNKKNCLLFVCFELRKNCRDLGSRIPLALSKIFKGSPNAILSQICFSSNIFPEEKK